MHDYHSDEDKPSGCATQDDWTNNEEGWTISISATGGELKATENKRGHFAKLKWFSIANITFL